MGEVSMYSELYDRIMKVDFRKAEDIFAQMSGAEQKQVMRKMVYNTESMIFYAFIQYMNEKNESILFHEIEFDMLTNALCHVEGAYQMGLFHNQRLLDLVPNSVKYLEWMLSFYDVKVITKDKAISIANKILELDADNQIARQMLKQIF